MLVPVKSFSAAKVRLAPAMSPGARADLVRAMGARVVAAAQPLPVTVVCDDDEVALWARSLGASVVFQPGVGLNNAVNAGVAQLAGAGATEVIVAHADLPWAVGLARVAGYPGVTLVPDRRDDGTNVACVPTGAGFTFAYGPGSFARHRQVCDTLALPYRVLRDPRLGWDVDLPADLEELDRYGLLAAFPGHAGRPEPRLR